MHQKRFGKPAHEVMISDDDFSILDKFKYDEHFGTNNQWSIYRNPDGMDMLLMNLAYPKLREAKDEQQAVFHLTWAETKQLRDFLNRQLSARGEEE